MKWNYLKKSFVTVDCEKFIWMNAFLRTNMVLGYVNACLKKPTEGLKAKDYNHMIFIFMKNIIKYNINNI